jgi:alpha-D-xyloside xylohydrolase
MSFEAYSTTILDYWVVAGDTPAEILEAYAGVTGTVPMMPEWGLGFWQSKLRYQSQEELLRVAREYKRRNLPIDVIVVDFFHWPLQGDWKFDETYWPDPEGMIKEIKDMGIEVMVSIWPTVDKRVSRWEEMVEKGYLVRMDRGIRTAMNFMEETVHFDTTNPGAREYMWGVVKRIIGIKGYGFFGLTKRSQSIRFTILIIIDILRAVICRLGICIRLSMPGLFMKG